MGVSASGVANGHPNHRKDTSVLPSFASVVSPRNTN